VRHLFIDFKKAHDLVRKEFLYNIHIEIGIPKKLVGATRWRIWLSGWGIVLEAARSRVQFPMGSLELSIEDPADRPLVLGLTQLLMEMSAKNIYWGVKAAGA